MGGKPRSSAFARIKADVLTIICAVPSGRIVTFGDIGAYMTVMPRHVAYILASLSAAELDILPWHRVVATDGGVRDRPIDPAGLSQSDRLRTEGVEISQGAVADMAKHRISLSSVPGDVRPGKSYGGRQTDSSLDRRVRGG